MKTPICDFVERYAADKALRLHMPGHKGVPFIGVEDRDITEVDGADVLYSGDGIIVESQKNASMLFGSGKTVYSTEGSSLCIRAMVYLVSLFAKKNGKRPVIWAARNSHKTFTSAVALVDVAVEWLYPDVCDNVISCRASAERIEKAIAQAGEMPTAIYLTSPDYLGAVSDIKGIADVCHKNGILLMIDNAHGAYLKFLPESGHPLDMGADICCDSAHKTLPVLTGGAYLHVSKNAPSLFFDMAEQAMSLFASTSPSYLILQSLDMANRYMSGDYAPQLGEMSRLVSDLKQSLMENGFSLVGDEKMKICIETKKYGYFGFEIEKYLARHGIVCEFCDRDFVVMMITPQISVIDLEKLKSDLLSLPRKTAIDEEPPVVGRAERKMTVREAVMSPSCVIDAEKSLGRVLSFANVSCPPAIPIVVCGEVIDEKAIECFKYYGIDKCRVVE